MVDSKPQQVAGHEAVEVQTGNPYRSYDRLVLRDPKGRTIWTVLAREGVDEGWNITAIRFLLDGSSRLQRDR